MATDGVFAPAQALDGKVEFFEAVELTDEAIQAVQTKVRQRVLCYLERYGVLDPMTVEEMLGWEDAGGFSVDASVRITGRANLPGHDST